MSKSCIHFCPCKTSVSVAHNTREKESIHEQVIGSSIPNESFYYFSESLTKLKHSCKKDYESTPRITGKNHKLSYRKAQRNFAPVKEAVVLIKEETTMDNLKVLCGELQKTYEIKPLQIHIHRDEGHIDKEGTSHYNLHAHLVFQFYDFKKHANCRYNWLGCSVMQDMVADTLQMERGKSSNVKHLTPQQYKLMMINKACERAEAEKEGLINLIDSMNERYGTAEEIANYSIEQCDKVISFANKRKAEIIENLERVKRERLNKWAYLPEDKSKLEKEIHNTFLGESKKTCRKNYPKKQVKL